MVYTVGASSLEQAIDNLPSIEKRFHAKLITALQSLSLNPNASPQRPLINVSHLSEQGYPPT